MKRLSFIILLIASQIAKAQVGSLDATFNTSGILVDDLNSAISPGSADRIYDVLVQADKKVIILGEWNASDLSSSPHSIFVKRYNENGTVDATFDVTSAVSGTWYLNSNQSANPRQIFKACLQADGKIILAGREHNGSNYDFMLIRLLSNGLKDNTFGSNGFVTIDKGLVDEQFTNVCVQSDGKILACGSALEATTGRDFQIMRFNTDGSLDNTFDTDGIVAYNTAPNTESDIARDILLQSDGKILIGGFINTAGVYSISIIRLNANGSLDNTFDTDGKVIMSLANGTTNIFDMELQGNGKLVVAGTEKVGSNSTNGILLRFNTDGSLDNTFDTDGKAICNVSLYDNLFTAMAIQADGKIIASGIVITVSSTVENLIVRFNTNGSLDNSFNLTGYKQTLVHPTKWSNVTGMKLATDNKIVQAGYNCDPNTYTNCDGAVLRYLGDAPATIHEIQKNTFLNIYPQPTTDYIYLQSKSDVNHDMSVSLYDYTGKVIYDFGKQLFTQQRIVKLQLPSQLKNGVYFLKCSNIANTSMEKIIIQN